MSRLVILKIFTLEAWIVRQFFFVSSAYFFVKLKHSLIKKVFANWCASTRRNFIFWSKIWNFRGFWVFDFGPYTKIENSENSEIVSILKVVLLEEVRNFRGLQVFDFGPYTKIENSKNSEIVSRLVIACWRKLEISEVSEFSVLALTQKSKTWKTRKLFQDL